MRYEMAPDSVVAPEAEISERASFIRRTYAHLAGAILAFIGIELAIFKVLAPVINLDNMMMAYFTTPWSQLIMLVAFIGVGYLARYWANSGVSAELQYLGLALYVVIEAILFVPILYIAFYFAERAGDQSGLIFWQAGILTMSLFAGLTAAVFITGKDFSFLGPILAIAAFIMLGIVMVAIVGSIMGVNPFGLGLWFSVVGVFLAAGFILYDTSNVMLHFRTDQHVAAALELFSSVAYLFFHILRILMSLRSN